MQKYPSLLEKPYKSFHEQQEAGDVRTAFSYMIDFFATCECYFSVVLTALYKKHKDHITDLERITTVVQAIEDTRPLSLGDWDDIFHKLVDDAQQQWTDNPFVTSLSAICNNKNNVFRGNGKFARTFVFIRNESIGHGTTLSNNQAVEYIEELAERMERLHEASLSVVDCGIDLLSDLYPLVHTDECGEYLFQTLKGNGKISFNSNDEDVRKKDVNVYNAAIEAWIRPLLPTFEIKQQLSWLKICKCSQAETGRFFEQMKDKDGKYTPELFVERRNVEQGFDKFVNSDKLFLPILGEAGQGKSNQLCHWVEKWDQVDDFVLILRGSDFANETLPQKLRTIFTQATIDRKKRFSGWSFSEMIALFCDTAKAYEEESQTGKKDHKLFFFIDAVNEAVRYCGAQNSESTKTLFQDLYSLFSEVSGKQVKVTFTCRNYTWRKQLAPLLAMHDPTLFFTQDDGYPLTLTGFLDDEMKRAFENYKQRSNIQTEYDALPLQCKLRLKDPLLLNFTCKTYSNRPLPTQTSELTSIALFKELLLDKKRDTNFGNIQVSILEEMANILFEDYMNGKASNSLDFRSKEHPRLQELMCPNEKVSTAFTLLEKDKIFISKTSGNKVEFVYERFLEFMLARHCYLKERAKLEEEEPIPAKTIYQIFTSTEARNEVFVNVMQNVLIMDYTTTKHPGTILQLLKDHGDDFEIINLVSATLNVMILENYETDLFKLERELISHVPADSQKTIKEYNKTCKAIDANLADAATIERHAQLTEELTPLIRLRTLAAASIVNGMLLTDYSNNSLYGEDEYELLWQLMEDPIVEVRNTACMLAYYVSGKDKTLSGSPLDRNITGIIINKMHNYLLESKLIKHISNSARRTRAINFLETATRLNVLRIIDLMLTEQADDHAKAIGFLNETRHVMDHITFHFRLLKVFMPLLSLILKRQLTFQSAYVNNLKEYAAFWDTPVPKHAPDGEWSQEKLVAISQFFYLYSKYFDQASHTLKPGAPDFSRFEKEILSAYTTGDSFSYFVLERILVVVGTVSWDIITPIIQNIEKVIQGSEWEDYSQMSFIYIMYQLGLKMEEMPDMLWEMLGRNCVDWTERLRGYFKARYSENANGAKLYKRNVMTWYACVWCARHGDSFNEQSVPLFKELILKAIDNYDKELLVHLIQNISELIADSGYIHTALGLLKIILKRIPDDETIERFEKHANLRYLDTSSKLTPLIGKVLGTAMNYYPREVMDFLTFETHGLTFPGLQKYRDEALNFNPGGERLPDLFTHKFGNFIIWALIHEQPVDDALVDCLKEVVKTDNCLDFFEDGAIIVLEHLFHCKI